MAGTKKVTSQRKSRSSATAHPKISTALQSIVPPRTRGEKNSDKFCPRNKQIRFLHRKGLSGSYAIGLQIQYIENIRNDCTNYSMKYEKLRKSSEVSLFQHSAAAQGMWFMTRQGSHAWSWGSVRQSTWRECGSSVRFVEALRAASRSGIPWEKKFVVC